MKRGADRPFKELQQEGLGSMPEERKGTGVYIGDVLEQRA
jgi:hypothetical protein